MKISIAILALSMVALPACNNNLLIPICRKGPQIILYVEARDSVSNALLTNNNLTGRIVEGTFTGNLTAFNSNGALEYLGADRPGTYDVFVNATGYKEWKKSGVAFVLGTDNCGIKPMELFAKLVRNP